MRFEDLNAKQRRTLEALGDELSAELEVMSPTPSDPMKDRNWDPAIELRRLAFQRSYVEGLISRTVRASREQGKSWHKIGTALGVTAEAARKRYRKPQDAK